MSVALLHKSAKHHRYPHLQGIIMSILNLKCCESGSVNSRTESAMRAGRPERQFASLFLEDQSPKELIECSKVSHLKNGDCFIGREAAYEEGRTSRCVFNRPWSRRQQRCGFHEIKERFHPARKQFEQPWWNMKIDRPSFNETWWRIPTGEAQSALTETSQKREETNVTIVQQREENVIPVRPFGNFVHRDSERASLSIAEEKWSIKDLMNKPVKLSPITWDTTMTVGSVIGSFDPLHEILSFGVPSKTFKIFAYGTFAFKIEFVVNATPMHCGQVLACFDPMNHVRFVDDVPDAFKAHIASGMPNVKINARYQNFDALEIPYFHPNNYIELQRYVDYDANFKIGQVHLVVQNQLRTVGAENLSVQITPYLWLIEADLHVPTQEVDALAMHIERNSQKYSFEDLKAARGAIEKEMATRVEIKFGEPQAKVISGISDTLNNVLNGDILGAVGSAVGTFTNMDKPDQVMPELNQCIKTHDNYSHGAGISQSTMLTLRPNSTIVHPPVITGVKRNEMDLSALVRLPMMFNQFQITPTTSQGDKLFRIPVNPMCNPTIEIPGIPPTSLDLSLQTFVSNVASVHDYWRGGLEYKIEAMMTAFQSFKLLVAFYPNCSMEEALAIPIEQANSVAHALFDFKEKQVINFEIPFQHKRLYAKAYPDVRWKTPIFPSVKYDYNTGVLVGYAATKLSANSSSPTTVDFNIYISGSKDLEFAVPRIAATQWEDIPPAVKMGEAQTGATDGVEPSADAPVDTVPNTETVSTEAPSVPIGRLPEHTDIQLSKGNTLFVQPASRYLMGETFKEMKDHMRRMTTYFKIAPSLVVADTLTSVCRIYITMIPSSYRMTGSQFEQRGNDLTSYFMRMYAGWRGGLIGELTFLNGNNQRQQVYIRHRSTTNTSTKPVQIEPVGSLNENEISDILSGWTNYGSTTLQPNIQKVAKVTVPFYSDYNFHICPPKQSADIEKFHTLGILEIMVLTPHNPQVSAGDQDYRIDMTYAQSVADDFQLIWPVVPTLSLGPPHEPDYEIVDTRIKTGEAQGKKKVDGNKFVGATIGALRTVEHKIHNVLEGMNAMEVEEFNPVVRVNVNHARGALDKMAAVASELGAKATMLTEKYVAEGNLAAENEALKKKIEELKIKCGEAQGDDVLPNRVAIGKRKNAFDTVLKEFRQEYGLINEEELRRTGHRNGCLCISCYCLKLSIYQRMAVRKALDEYSRTGIGTYETVKRINVDNVDFRMQQCPRSHEEQEHSGKDFRLNLSKDIAVGEPQVFGIGETTSEVTQTAREIREFMSSTSAHIQDAVKIVKNFLSAPGKMFSTVAGTLMQPKLIDLLVDVLIEFVEWQRRETVSQKLLGLVKILRIFGVGAVAVAKFTNYVVKKVKNFTNKTASNPPEQGHEGIQVGEAQVFDVLSASAEFLPVLTGVVGAAAGLLVTGELPEKNSLKAWKKSFVNTSKNAAKVNGGIMSTLNIFTKIKELMEKAIKYFFGLSTPQYAAIRALKKQSKAMAAWAYEVSKLNCLEIVNKSVYDNNLRKKIMHLRDEGNEFVKIMADKPDSTVVQSFWKMYLEIVKLSDHVLRTKSVSQYRVDPFCVCLFGDPGTGKSYLSNRMAHLICDIDDDPMMNRIYVRKPEMQFWDGYYEQGVLCMDDFMQILGTEGIPELQQFFLLKSNVPFPVNKAPMEEKGTMFNSKAIVMTTNSEFPDPSSIASREALLRRRDVLVETKFKPGWDKKKLKQALKEGTVQPDTYEHLFFNIWDSDLADGQHRVKIIDNLDYMGLKKYVSNNYIAHRDVQLKSVKILNSQKKENPIVMAYLRGEIDHNTMIDQMACERLGTDEPDGVTPKKGEAQGKEDDEIQEVDFDEYARMIDGQPLKYPEQTIPLLYAKSMGVTLDQAKDVFKVIKERAFSEPATLRERAKALVFSLKSFVQKAKEKLSNLIRAHPIVFGVMLALGLFGFVLGASWLIAPEKTMSLIKKTHNKTVCALCHVGRAFGVAGALLCYACDQTYGKAKNREGECGEWDCTNKCEFEVEGTKYCLQCARLRTACYEVFDEYAEKKNRIIQKHIEMQEGMAQNQHYGAHAKPSVPKPVNVVLGNSQIGDVNASAIVEGRIARNLWTISSERYTQCAFQVKGTLFLTTSHFFNHVDDEELLTLRNGNIEREVRCNKSKVLRLGKKDLCIFDSGPRINQAPDSTKLFISEADLKDLPKCRGELVVRPNNEIMRYQIEIEQERYFGQYYDNDEHFMIAHGWKYFAATGKGDCGGVIVQHNEKKARKLIGIHVAGYRSEQSEGWGEILTREELEKLVGDFENKHGSQIIGLDYDALKTGYPQFSAVPEDLAKVQDFPRGNFSIYGRVPIQEQTRMPTKTSLRRTKIHGLAFPVRTGPSVLRPYDRRMDEPVNIIYRGVEKYAGRTVPPLNSDLEAIKEHMVAWAIGLRKRACRPPQLLTDDEILNGNAAFEHMDRMNMDSSPGYPEEKFRPAGEKGKAYLFKLVDGKYEKKEERPWIAMEVMERMAKQNRRVKTVHKPCLKDEKRKFAKIRVGKTRVFNVLPVYETMLMRKYFLDFRVAIMNARAGSFCQVGIDPTGPEWTRMFSFLRRYGDLGGDGDHGEFDGRAFQEYQMLYADCANAFYNDGPENANVRRVLMHGTVHSYNILGDLFYQDHQGVPSGTAITADVNSFINQCYFYQAWRCLAREHRRFEMMDLHRFDENVGFIDFGDDDAFTTNERVLEWFNQRNIAAALKEYGLNMTDAKKTQEHATKGIMELSFLKRGFRSHPTFPNIKLAPLEKDSIEEMTNWIRECPDEEEALYENLYTAQREAYHHGVEYYMDYQRKVNAALEKIGLPLISGQYSDADLLFLSKFDM